MARMDVYTKWNAWDEALGSFRDRITFEDAGETVVDGRLHDASRSASRSSQSGSSAATTTEG